MVICYTELENEYIQPICKIETVIVPDSQGYMRIKS